MELQGSFQICTGTLLILTFYQILSYVQSANNQDTAISHRVQINQFEFDKIDTAPLRGMTVK